jgi:hypothetical protein
LNTDPIELFLFIFIETLTIPLDEALSQACLTADVWTKKDMTSSYLGVTIHFISKDEILERAVLDFIEFPLASHR